MKYALRRLLSPSSVAILYSILSVATSMLAAYMEGTLWHSRVEVIGGHALINHSFISNISTIADFALLNPLVVYFLISARYASFEVLRSFKRWHLLSPYHQYGVAVLSIALASKAMMFYLDGFIGGNNFDAVVAIDSWGHVAITRTGWVVSFWTALFMATLFYCIIENIVYASFQLSLKLSDIKYFPFHPDESGGLGFLMRPSIIFLRAMGVLLITFTIFVVYDFLLNEISESNRVWGFAIYVAIVTPVFFLPLIHIHRLMKMQIRDIVSEIVSSANQKPFLQGWGDWQNKTQASELLQVLDILEKYKKLQQQLPIWPMPIRSLLEQLSALLIAIVPIVQKLVIAAIH